MNAIVQHNLRIAHAKPSAEKEKLLTTLRGLLAASFELRNEGAAYAKLAHSQGYADGFMRCLLTSGVVTEQELLSVVQAARRGTDGPATSTAAHDDASSARVVAA